MAEPTLIAYQESNFADSGGTEALASMTWLTGDFFVILGITADNGVTIDTPAVTGLTFSAVASTPTNVASSCKAYAWTATAASASSGSIVATGTSTYRGMAGFQFRGSDGLGNTSISAALGSTTIQSLIRGSANSHVVQIWGDWDAGNDVTVTLTPSGGTAREAQFISGQYSVFVQSWGDQGAAGTTSYGFSAGNQTDMSAITLEIKGTASASPNLPTVNDAATLTESITMKMDLKNLSANDTVTLAESVGMKMHLGPVGVNDTAAVSDALTMHMPISLRMEKLS